MEFTRELDITPEEFFDQIERSVCDDVEAATGNRPTRGKLNGLRYQKHSTQRGKGSTKLDVKIRKYRYPEVYEVKFTYSAGANTITYRVEPRDGGLTLNYSEKFVNPRARGGIFEDLRLKRYEKRAEHRADRTIRAIVDYAKKGRSAHHSNPLLAEIEDGADPKGGDEA